MERETDITRKLCKCWIGRDVLCQHLPLHEVTEVRQGESERMCVYFVLCTFAPRFNSRFSFSLIPWGPTQTLSQALAESSWGADSSIPFAAPSSLMVCGGMLLPAQFAYPPTCCPSQAPQHTFVLFCKTKQMKQNPSQRVFIDKETGSLCRFTWPTWHLLSQYCHLLLVWRFWKPMENIHPMPGRV